MYTENPNRIVVTGPCSDAEATTLVHYCTQLRRWGQAQLTIDVTGVTSCDRAGLDTWRNLLDGSTGIAVTIQGGQWSQFLDLLRLTPAEHLPELCDEIRAVLPAASGRREPVRDPGRAAFDRRYRAASPTAT